ncbi:MAG: beta-lactamase [Gammaproteobacteria bacterium]|nr:beta-lactamase [Gammaproteobacteria bacterium]
MKTKLSIIGTIFLTFLITASAAKPAIKNNQDVRLYTLDCGSVTVHDIAPFSSTGAYPHESAQFSTPCFLIKDSKGWLLWDLGMGEQYLGRTVEDTKHGVSITAKKSLIQQLKVLGLSPNDIRFVGLSHAHFDHTGNASLFPNAVWLIEEQEYAYANRSPLPSSVDSTTAITLKPYHKILLKGNYDVFGDGKVEILYTPGHTPGHASLEIHLPHTGVVILSGDLYHMRKSYVLKQIPSFNTDPAQTKASMEKVDAILKNSKGRLVIQHDASDIAALPQIPNYLD